MQISMILLFQLQVALANPATKPQPQASEGAAVTEAASNPAAYDPHEVYLRDIKGLSERLNGLEEKINKSHEYIENNKKNYAACANQDKLYLGNPDGDCLDLQLDKLNEKFLLLSDKIESLQQDIAKIANAKRAINQKIPETNASKNKASSPRAVVNQEKTKLTPTANNAKIAANEPKSPGLSERRQPSPQPPANNNNNRVNTNRVGQESAKAAIIGKSSAGSAHNMASNKDQDYDNNARTQFRQILEYMKKNENPAKIKLKFEKFIKTYSQHYLVASAYRHLGAMALREGENNNAAIYFVKGYKFDTQGPISYDNLLGLARSLFKLGKKDQGCKALARASVGRKNSDKTFDLEVARLKKVHSCGK